MKTRRSFLMSLAALPLAASQMGASCGGSAVTTITQVEAGIQDAQLVIQMVQASVDAYFAGHPNPTLQTKIDSAINDTAAALRVVTGALAGALSLTDANVQAAIAAFNTAFSALVALIGQIGIQTSAAAPRGKAVTVDGVTTIAPPILLQWAVKAKP